MKIIYITHQTPTTNADTLRRVEMAKRTIEKERQLAGNWVRCKTTYDRDASSLGDVNLPFIRDMIEAGMKLASEGDIVLLLNADICVSPNVTKKIVEACSSGGATWSHRYDFKRIGRPIESEEEFDQAQWYCGTDFFAMTKEWWGKYGHQFPDAVLGREAWDMLLRRTMRENGGVESFKTNYHEGHPSPWEQNRELPGNVHNRNLASAWLAEHGGDYYDWKK